MSKLQVEILILDTVEKKKRSQSFSLEGNTLTIGRGQKVDLPLKDSNASSFHCSLIFSSKGITLLDNDSSNGTLIDNEKIDKCSIDIREGFRVGKFKLLVTSYEYEDTEEEPEENEEPKSSIKSKKKARKTSRVSREESIPNFIISTFKGFFSSPVRYLDDNTYGGFSQKYLLPFIILAAIITSVPNMLTLPLLGIVSALFYIIAVVGFSFVVDLTKKFTKIQANRLEVLHFLAVQSILGLLAGVLSVIPGVGFLGAIYSLIIFVLGIKGFYNAFKPKIFPMIVIVLLHGFIISVVFGPIFSMVTPKVSETEQLEKTQNLINSFIKKAVEANK